MHTTRASRAVVILALLLEVGCQGLLNNPAGPGSEDELSNGSAQGQLACAKGPVGSTHALSPLTRAQFENSVRDLFGGKVQPSAAYPKATGVNVTGFSSDSVLNNLSADTAEALESAANETALDLAAHITDVLPCAERADRACAEEFVDTYVPRAFRRPLASGQRDALLGLYDGAMKEHGNFPVAIAELTAAMLQRPEFVYRAEIGTQAAPDVVALDAYELATRLSFLFWDSLPDAELLEAAGSGALESEGGLREQAERLVADERFERVLHKFVREWTHLRVYRGGEKDQATFGEFDDTLASSIQEELDRFVSVALRKGKGGFEALIAGRETYVNQPMADLYGVPSEGTGSASDWQLVTLDADRAGLVTRAAVLSGFAGDREVSHVKRGHFVREGLLCSSLGSPPANAQSAQPAYPAGATRREQSAILEKVPQCGGCHVQMDRIGLAFDDFDAIGRKLDGDVDVTGEIVYGGDATGKFEGSAELADVLANSDQVRECVAKQWFRYSFGRREQDQDACTFEAVSGELERTEGDLAAMIAGLAETDGFRYRRLSKESE